MWLSQVEELIWKQTLVSRNRRFCVLAIQLDSRKSPERNHRTWKRHVDQMESTGIGIDSPYLILFAGSHLRYRPSQGQYPIFGLNLTQSLSESNYNPGEWRAYGLVRNEP